MKILEESYLCMNYLRGKASRVLFVGLSFLLLFSFTVPAYASPAKDSGSMDVDNVTNIDLSKSINEDEMEAIGENIESYMVLNQDGTVSVNATPEQLGTTAELLDQYMEGVRAINYAVKNDQLVVNEDLTVSAPEATPDHNITPEWIWDAGFKGTTFQLSNAEADELVYKLEIWAAGAGAVGIIASYVASKGVPYAAGVALASGLIGFGLGAAALKINHYIGKTHGVVIYVSNWNPINILQVSTL